MKKPIKTAAKIAAGAGAAFLALGEVVYEGVINISMNNKIRSTGAFDNPDEKQFWETNEIVREAEEWYDAKAAGDTVLASTRIKRNTYAKVYFPENASNQWAIVIHGYTDSPRGMAHYAKTYYEMGFNVIMPHMIGHGSDKSHYTSMGYYDKLIILDWIEYILTRDSDAKIILHGVSMGSATTMMTTGEELPSNVVAAVADCGYTSAWEEYYSQVGPMFHLPPAPVVTSANIISKLRGNFDFKEAAPIKAVVNSKTPTLFIHGDADTFVPYAMMKPLYEACSASNKEMLTVPGAFHAASAYFDNELYWNTVKKFISKYVNIPDYSPAKEETQEVLSEAAAAVKRAVAKLEEQEKAESPETKNAEEEVKEEKPKPKKARAKKAPKKEAEAATEPAEEVKE